MSLRPLTKKTKAKRKGPSDTMTAQAGRHRIKLMPVPMSHKTGKWLVFYEHEFHGEWIMNWESRRFYKKHGPAERYYNQLHKLYIEGK